MRSGWGGAGAPRWCARSRCHAQWLGFALVLASCASAPKARADVRDDVDRALRQTSPPEKSGAHGGERHEGTQVGDQQGSGGSKEKSASKEKSRRTPAGGEQREVAQLRRQVRELQRKIDRLASREEAKGGEAGDLRKAATNLCSTLDAETSRGHQQRRARKTRRSSASGERGGSSSGKPSDESSVGKSGGGGSSGSQPASEGESGRQQQLDALARQLDDAERDVQRMEQQRSGKSSGGSASSGSGSSGGESGASQSPGGSKSGGSGSSGDERQGRRGGEDRVERSAMKAATVSGEVAAVDRQQLVVRSDGGNLVLISLGSDTVIHSHDEQLDPGALVRGTPVRVQYRPEGKGELHAVDVALRDTD